MPRGSKTMMSNQLLYGRGVPCEDEGLEKGSSLNPNLLIITTFYKLKCMRICLACIGYYMCIYNEPLMIIIALVLALVENQRQHGHG